MSAGKVLGVMVGLVGGLLIGGPWAIVLGILGGFAAGHFYDEQHAPPPDFPELFAEFPAPPVVDSDAVMREDTREDDARAERIRHRCALFVEVARADGDVRREEVREVRRHFETVVQADAQDLEVVRRQLKALLGRPASLNLQASLEACREDLSDDERYTLLDALYDLALVDGPLQRSERESLRHVAEGLDIPEDTAQELATLHLGDGLEHYALLGLTPEATDAQVKSTFRRLAAAHHPDKVAHQGAQAAEQAAHRFQEIRDAYEEIRKLRGL
ncbi:molecular chaperone DjiA [Corallococcus sp. H22C18031201]|uniref:J domain-containing protein n=1 Tax=Citreicoccus inhibens TaxID=2849499 RepID=UPI000E7149ED|nr:J domain-containing protein [Citreicoccus inhibens]MBU8900083.1 J domain-containing protein [Citreicoccus inhibens]RJS20684.1 molecular chaperone DjiA [Corallococcus sp. H22C18031201]